MGGRVNDLIFKENLGSLQLLSYAALKMSLSIMELQCSIAWSTSQCYHIALGDLGPSVIDPIH